MPDCKLLLLCIQRVFVESMLTNRKTVWLILLVFCMLVMATQICDAVPLLGTQANFEDNSKIQGKSKPIFVHCDEIGNHLNCMLYCKSRGHTSGNCGGDFTCNCF